MTPPSDVEIWVSEAMPRLLGLARAMTGDATEAADLVQETLAKVIVRWARVSQADHLDAYVKKVMVNAYISGKRRHWSTEVVSHEVVTSERATDGAVPVDDALGERGEMLDALSRLAPRQRAALAMRYYEDLPDGDIADVLGCSVGAVRTAIHRGLAPLRARWPAEPGVGP